MKRSLAILLACAWLAATTGVARAEDPAVYEVEGEADAGGAEPRVAALDDAFARAIGQALAELVDAEARKANRAALNEHIVGRARLWIVRFSVTKDETADGRRQLTVAVRVDRDKMRARLGELNVPTASGGEQPRPGAKSAVVLMRIAEPKGARASYGAGAEKELPGMGALAASLRGAGMAVRKAPAAGPVAKGSGEDDLPLEDDEAAALAGQAKAEVAAVVGVTVGEPVVARGVPESVALVSAHVRLVQEGKGVGQGAAAVAARGTGGDAVGAAIERAVAAAASDVMPPAPQELGKGAGFTGDDTPIAEPGVVLVRLAPKTPWGLVAAEQKWLAGAKGVTRAVLRRASPSGWVIGVTTGESVERIAQIARKPPMTGATSKVKVVGEIVEVALQGAP